MYATVEYPLPSFIFDSGLYTTPFFSAACAWICIIHMEERRRSLLPISAKAHNIIITVVLSYSCIMMMALRIHYTIDLITGVFFGVLVSFEI